MSNLESAKTAIEAEITHAKEGLAFYHSRIGALEKTLSQLASVTGSRDVPLAVTATATTPAPRKSVGKAVKPEKVRTSAEKVNKGNELPFTGGDYWANLVTDQPRSVSEILESAISKFGFVPTKGQIKKLAGRQTFALNALVKSKKIKDSGAGRNRRFFR